MMNREQILSLLRKDGLWQAVFLLFTPFTAVWLMQFTYGANPFALTFPVLVANALCVALLFWLLCALVGRIAPCTIGIHIAAGSWGAANCFVNTFRGTPILPWDFSALGTAASVAGNYHLFLTWQMGAAIFLAAALVVFLHPERRKARLRLTTRKRLPLRLACLAAGLACLLFLLPSEKLEKLGVKTDVWDQAGAYRTGGCLAVFYRNTEFLEVEEPEGYSPEEVDALLAEVEPLEPAAVSVQKPNIIAIMNESWADFESYGNLQLSESVTDYIRSLDNSIFGHTYTSVFGAGTSASEFEFLTGNTMAFLPSGSIPYQQYVLGPTASLASLLKAQGYDTLAFHPGGRTSWQRNLAYPQLGFDQFKCVDDMDVEQTMEHGYVSDQSDFEQIIWELEHKEAGKPLFLFNVTIQNHGSYTAEDYPAQVTLTDQPGKYPQAEQYLTLANKTDQAFRTLVEYFQNQEEPTIILMFGDHQPSVEQGFLDKAYGVTQDQMNMNQYMGKYETPFVIWANYPLPQEGPEITSLNFLGLYLLRYAGIGGTVYDGYLWQLQQQLPALTFVGYMDSEGQAHSHLETNDYAALIEAYQQVQYNNLFGGSGRRSAVFDP